MRWIVIYPTLEQLEPALIMTELQRAKRVGAAPPLVRKIGNPSSRENLVMTSSYERTNVLRPYRAELRAEI